MQQPLADAKPAHPRTAARRHSWISTSIAFLAIAAAATLCFASFVEADRNIERLDSIPTPTPVSSTNFH